MNRKFMENKPKWPIYLLNSTVLLKNNNKIDIVLIGKNVYIGQFQVMARLSSIRTLRNCF